MSDVIGDNLQRHFGFEVFMPGQRDVIEHLLACHDGCQVSELGAHFGEPLATPCGHCSRCLDGGEAPAMPERPAAIIDEGVWAEVDALRSQDQYAGVLGEPRAVARLLCGVSSPRLRGARLSSHALFGRLAHAPFDRVLALVRRRP